MHMYMSQDDAYIISHVVVISRSLWKHVKMQKKKHVFKIVLLKW